MGIIELPENYKEYIISMRREFHRYPELGFNEFRTSERIKEELSRMGIPFVSIAKTGIVAWINGKKPGKTIALRADMDALRIEEKNEIEYKSKNKGIMHACGHDGHMAMLLGAAKILNDLRLSFNGCVKLLFQPAEELVKGAKMMINEGALSDVDSIFGIHLWSGLQCGKISVEEGYRMASADIFKIKIKGKRAHGSVPNEGIDSVVAASAVVMNLQTIASREISPLEPVVVSVGRIESGTGFNIISGEAFLEGTTRCFNPDIRKKLPAIIERIAKNTAYAFRADAEIEYISGTGAVVNDSICSKIAEKSVEKILGKKSICKMEKITASEDFSEYTAIIPGVFAFIGCGNNKDAVYPHHSDKFNIDERALEYGTELYAQYALDYLNWQI